MCIGHCRYATTGVPVRSNAQPFVIRHIKGPMALAHNGNLTNSAELRSEFELSGAIFHSTSDTEVIAYAITRERLSSDSIEQAVEQTMDRLKGAYSLVVMSPAQAHRRAGPAGLPPAVHRQAGRKRHHCQRELRHHRRGRRVRARCGAGRDRGV